MRFVSLVVKYGQSKVLLTGDSSAATLNEVLQTPCNKEALKDVMSMLLPHHGSNLKGAYSWFYNSLLRTTSGFMKPFVTIISSNPIVEDHLPWFAASELRCSRLGSTSYTSVAHEISTCKRRYPIHDPVFLTSDAKNGFLTVELYDSGVLKIFDGKRSIGLENIIYNGALMEFE